MCNFLFFLFFNLYINCIFKFLCILTNMWSTLLKREDTINARTDIWFVQSVWYLTCCLNLLPLDTKNEIVTWNWFMKLVHEILIIYIGDNPHRSVWSLTHSEKDWQTQLIFYHFWVTIIYYLFRSQFPYTQMVTDPFRKELTNTTYFLPSLGNLNYNVNI